MSDPSLTSFLKSAYPDGSWPRPFHILEALQKIAAGASLKDAARAVGTSTHHLQKALESKNPEFDILGFKPEAVTEEDRRKAATILGGLLLGQVAERAFEDIYRTVHTRDDGLYRRRPRSTDRRRARCSRRRTPVKRSATPRVQRGTASHFRPDCSQIDFLKGRHS